ncbi:velvet factor-domain-containing protein [Suillus clintonianus]|uniref:velvet factor-domain-containing protein n=1 Tax=Suillus clintonianus TaxID=1904413 RepID=UPI001B881104|nr:velvet factor-domain-containing protein [Suillus clintonianus]KAG2135996.1 velvet factor-domain-containing protein [Suillus clintonianus]
MHESTRRTTLSYINVPIHFSSGQFQGRCVRAELVEIQKADLGRKYARVDRRPLDPPPVVQLKLYCVHNEGSDHEYEQEVQDYDDIQNLGLLCNVDLFQVSTQPDSSSEPSSLPRHPPQISPVVQPVRPPSGGYPLPSILPSMSTQSDKLPPLSSSSRVPVSDAKLPHLPPYAAYPESMKCTTALSGATFVQPACIDYEGKRALVFPFADLAVKIEGDFFLRYRIFDIFSRTSSLVDVPVQAECYGGPFHIYSTKEFPGLQPSTELSKQLSRYGVRLNTRETERKRKKKGSETSVIPSRTSKSRATRIPQSGSECD